MENSFVMVTDAPVSLNFLIYIQNIFLNQNRQELRFPYLSTRIVFKENFELKYKELWNEVSERISENNQNDAVFLKEKDLFYQRLFVNDDSAFNEMYKTFEVWWNSFPGRFSIERSIGDVSEGLYVELTNSLVQKGKVPKKELYISVIYDECLLANTEVSSYFAVLSIRDFFVHSQELIHKLLASID
ncbi:hypothetical protein HOO54_18095 [Bacillus sp. WMMC1349]|uniref:hypothetical protein n=1 Tax=Bacillus sp. WMMC1349 TaxID=2736254 RepID=UPI0015570708|nr:hypothetical protein [Bacillus sp. WMMC1349]NPC94078.1 hypothetical protein [Bacillus sp. WMMC1349]